jgi:hypothetical protein
LPCEIHVNEELSVFHCGVRTSIGLFIFIAK